ncbi:asparagine synthase (glutamine-hydrolyzing) [Nonomuraea sp. C10]|uniref:asparagine synthase (glutamine-hydrolyzing) n=1 Tax=Nonomuraea sp. C10 TaxID=2600577 RepID=UPI0011CE9056|nr:asparagine synthase (glutamine-hydrolyzing) [Nonomuraea sp. C10]TXK41381.1 asparagine synthase (glutamine-hydrolyzing) [Nonomuraea sp. C10]
MCGLSGEIRFDDAEADLGAVGRMTEAMRDRGPDGSGLWSHGPTALGHRRLKIIDLSEKAAQPMVDAELGLAAVFNGCLYNYRELRAELRRAGYRFQSGSDTEVLVKAFHRWGAGCVDRFTGMFAFAVAERGGGRLTLGRDRLGIKPLYLSEDGRRLRFASSLPALLAAGGVDTGIDPVALHHYMTFHSLVPGERTILAGVRKLPAATVRVIEADGTSTEHRYWEPRHRRPAAPADDGEWRRAVLDALRTAVRRRMVADVPVGVLLSGGLDSSLIVALLAEQGQREPATFSIGFEPAGGEQGDEFAYSDLVARRFGTDHHRIRVPDSRLAQGVEQAVHAMSEPMARILAPDHLLDSDVSGDLVRAHLARPGADTALDAVLRLETTAMMVDDPVKRLDNMTMAHGLEARTPFLDHELVELAAACPAELKLAGGGKGVLKDAARRMLPAEVVDRPKGYFPVPAIRHVEGRLLDLVRDALTSRAARDRGLFRRDYVDRLLADPGRDRAATGVNTLWQLGLLELWLQAHLG